MLLLLPSVPGLGHRVNGVKLWVKVGPMQFQPGELAKIFLIVFLAGYLRDKREVARTGPAQGPRAAARDLGRRDARARADERPRLGAAQLRDLPRDGLRRHGAGSLRRRRHRALPRRLGGALQRARPRRSSASRSGCTPGRTTSVYCSINGKLDYRQNCDSYQLVKSLYSIANGGYGGTGLGKGTFTTVDGTQLIPYLNTDFVYSAIAQELGLIGAAGLLLVVHGARRARDADRPDRPGRLLEAARRRASRSGSRCRPSSSSEASSASSR